MGGKGRATFEMGVAIPKKMVTSVVNSKNENKKDYKNLWQRRGKRKEE